MACTCGARCGEDCICEREPRFCRSPYCECLPGLCKRGGFVDARGEAPAPRLTLPTDSNERKDVPLFSGCYSYFPAALVGVAKHSKKGNDKHNPGQPLHHVRSKSMDHPDCVARHSTDLADMLAALERGGPGQNFLILAILDEADALAWRALAWSQQLHETYGGAPMAPAAKP